MNFSEALSAEVIEEILVGARMNYILDQSNSQCDFMVESAGGRSFPLEVTKSTLESYLSTSAAIRDPKKGGPFVKSSLCSHGWYVVPLPGADINLIRSNIDGYLQKIETEGLSHFFSPLDASKSVAVKRIYQDLKIEAGNVHSWKEESVIGIGLPGQEAILHSEYAIEAIDEELCKIDNRKKLAATGADERHLFVYIDHVNYEAWNAINHASPPENPPDLPDEITHIWAVAKTMQPEEYIVWQASTYSNWKSLKILGISYQRITKRIKSAS